MAAKFYIQLFFVFLQVNHLVFPLFPQTAADIICATEEKYRSLINYSDEGELLSSYYGEPPSQVRKRYFLAADCKKNIYHWVNESFLGSARTTEFTIKEHDSLGIYSSIIYKEGPFRETLYGAAGRLIATGGGILLVTCSLLYEDFFWEGPGDASILQLGDSIRRLPDTSILGEDCYSIMQTQLTFFTQQMADRDNRFLDSIHALHPELAGLPRPVVKKPGPGRYERKYFIRKKDWMIVRREEYHFMEERLTNSTVLYQHPSYDREDFMMQFSKN